MSGHTKGPWTVGTDSVVYDERHRDPICDAAFRSDEVSLANANLIAAAPDLLEALELVSAELQKYENTHHPEGSDGARDFLVKLMHAKHAIAKARGEA